MKKFAIIGCGGIGDYHLSHLISYKDIDLVGFCDLILSRAEDFAQRAGTGRAFTDYREMYDSTKPDAVFICVPPGVRGVIEFEAIARGIHLFIEKPMALDLPLARRIGGAIAAKGLISAVGFQCRYDDDINLPAKEYIAGHPIMMIQGSRVGGIHTPDWWRIKSQSGGQLAEQTVHQMDMMRYLLGMEPVEVFSMSRRGTISNEEWPGFHSDDLSATVIRFADGTVATMSTGCYSENGSSWDTKMTFGAKSSRMEYKLCRKTAIFGLRPEDMAAEAQGTIRGDGTQRRNENELGILYNSEGDYGDMCDRTFVDAVISGNPSKIRSSYADALKTLAFVLACNESMESGLPVKVQA